MSKNQSNPVLESLLLALTVHLVILAIIYFSDDALRSKSSKTPPDSVQMDMIELTEELLQIEQEQKPALESILDKYKNLTAKANTETSNTAQNYFNKEKLDQEIYEELKNMEQAEFERLKENHPDSGIDPTQKITKPKDPETKDPTDKPKNGGSETSYAKATAVYDFSRDPDTKKYPTYRCVTFGQIVVEISVDINGKVISARAVSGDLDDDCLKSESEKYAKRWKFGAKFDAPKSEKGTITFTFLPQ